MDPPRFCKQKGGVGGAACIQAISSLVYKRYASKVVSNKSIGFSLLLDR